MDCMGGVRLGYWVIKRNLNGMVSLGMSHFHFGNSQGADPVIVWKRMFVGFFDQIIVSLSFANIVIS